MKIGVIQASSQKEKHEFLCECVRKYAKGHEVVSFGCDEYEEKEYSYIDISVLVGFLLASEAVDFVVTGCSSGQGMMLACNSMPGILCGYAPTPKDAYLFAQINDGNAVSLPLGEDYTFAGYENCEKTIEALFSEPFGQGWPKEEAERKLQDSELLKQIRHTSQKDFLTFAGQLDNDFLFELFDKENVIQYILNNGRQQAVTDWIRWRQ